ncbi:MAG: hypothetical protein CMP20_10415 [Rickettsiales bacterium]|nr:hypothetical protein [Rickettsiales bacterium]
MADPQNQEMFHAAVKLCVRKGPIEVVAGQVASVQEMWTMARSAGFRDGDETGLDTVKPCLGVECGDPWPAIVGQPLSPFMIHKFNEAIAQGATHLSLTNPCGREINVEPEPWEDFVRPVRVSYEGSYSVAVHNTADIWEFLESKGVSDDADLTCKIFASDSEDSHANMPARKGQPLQASIMLLTNTAAPEGLAIETIRIDFQSKLRLGRNMSMGEAVLCAVLSDL